ncbi:MAG: DUF2911 domain-containing protein [Chitinophagaceae bacterium]|nr:DUF2911 domain-containing protein [Chitinophagaceae bacterium]
MRKFIFIVFLAFAGFHFSHAQALRTPQPSTTTTIKQEFALSNIELSYSRPSMKGRTIFGDLVPYGKVWRTGANGATTITFGEDVNIGGTAVKAGKYGLLTIPEATKWTIILTKQLDVTSPAAYKQDQDVVRVSAETRPLNYPMENFTLMFGNISANACELWMLWDNTIVSLPIKTDVDTKVMAQINDAMNKDSRPYFSAAMYYMDNNKDLNKALEWLDKAAVQNPQAFWVLHQKANCQAKLGKKAEAIATAEKSITLAKAAKNDDYVKLNEDLIKKLK